MGWFDFLVTDYGDSTTFPMPNVVDSVGSCYDTSSLWSRDIVKFQAQPTLNWVTIDAATKKLFVATPTVGLS